MTEQRPERLQWQATNGDPISIELAQGPDLTEHLMGRFEPIEFVEPQGSPLIPEGTLTEVYSADGEMVGHAEAFYNDDGTGTLKIYGVNHNPEDQP